MIASHILLLPWSMPILFDINEEMAETSIIQFKTRSYSNLVIVRGLIHQEVSPKCANEESSTERRSCNRQANRSPQG